jgi:PAN domain
MATTYRISSLRWLGAVALILFSAASLAGELTLVPGTDLLGGDYNGFALDTAEPDACRQACARDARCKAYTYVNPGLKGPSAMCFLKDSVPTSSSNACCTSGKKVGAVRIAPAPTPIAPPAKPLILHLLPQPCATFHVDVEAAGQDKQDGSIERPFATINAAIASATERKCSLDIVLAPGTYVENLDVAADLKLKGADKTSSEIQGGLRTVGNFKTVLSDVGFSGAPFAVYKEGGTIQMTRVAVSDIVFAPTAGIDSPGAVRIVNATGVVSGLVVSDVSSPALLVEGPEARIKAVALVVSDSEPVMGASQPLRNVGAVEVRGHAAVMGSLWKIFDNQLFGVLVTEGASLHLSSAEVTNTFSAVGGFGPDNLIVLDAGILEIDHVVSTLADRGGALAGSAFFTAHHSKLQSNKYGFINVANDVYTDPTAAHRCATADDMLVTGNTTEDVMTGFSGSLAVPNAPLCVPSLDGSPGQNCDKPETPALQDCKVALRW